MALWENKVGGQPKWLLSSGGVNNTNEVALVDDEPGVGWRIWHAKESGNAVGVGRGWWEILATQDTAGALVDVGGPVISAANTLVLSVAIADVNTPIVVNLLATDPDAQAITFTATGTDCTTAIATNVLTISAITAAAGASASVVWRATANSVDSPDVTITINVTA
jgi:hypothetical protein